MRLTTKLLSAQLLFSLLIAFIGLASIRIGEKPLRRYIIESSVILADEVLDKIDRNIFRRIEDCQLYCLDVAMHDAVMASNQEFEALADREAYITKQDEEWASTPKETVTPFIRGMLDNWLSIELKEKVNYYKKKYGYYIYSELFITNKYGANIALTGKTSDYRQNDEDWWQKAKRDGLYIGDIKFDDSADMYSIDIGVRINDREGNFIGVMKAIFNIEGVINILKSFRPSEQWPSRHFKLLTKDGRLLYSGGIRKSEFYKDESGEEYFKKIGLSDGYFIARESDEEESLFIYTREKGYRDYHGLGMILAVEYATKEIFSPVIKLRDTLLVILLFGMLVSIITGIMFFRFIHGPILKLKNAAIEIGRGRLDTRVEIEGKDEIGILAESLNTMAGDLNKTMVSIDILERAQEETVAAYTQLKVTQEQLLQVEKLDAIGRLAAGVAHEVRNPLGIIKQGMSYLENKISPLEEKSLEVCKMIKANVDRADSIVKILLDFSRASSLEIMPEEINSILKNSLMLIQFTGEFSNIEIADEVPEGLPKVFADGKKLEQVFINILLNAIQAMPDGGKLILRCYLARLNKEKPGVGHGKEDNFRIGENALVVEIEDTGIGIPQENLKRVFDPFFTTKEFGKGTGLGLSVARNIIIMHKGLIELESQAGKGTKVTVTLKLADGGAYGKEKGNGC